MIKRLYQQLTPPIVQYFLTREGALRLVSFIQLQIASLKAGKQVNHLFYEELRQAINEHPEIEKLFSAKKFKQHYVYCGMRDSVDHPDLFISQIRYYRMYCYFKEFYPDIFDDNTTVLDVGDTSGLLLSALNKRGTSLNINQECVDHIQRNGVEADLGDAERLGYEDKSFDYCFSFQCVEHLLNPLAAIRELGRVARKKVFLSVPYTRQTKIYDLGYWIRQRKDSWKQNDVKEVDCHVFEFSTQDLRKLLSHTDLEYETSFPIAYFDNNSPLRRQLNQRYLSYFNFFVLKPKVNTTISVNNENVLQEVQS